MKNLAKQYCGPRMSHFSLLNHSLYGHDFPWYPTLQHRCPSKNDENKNTPPDSVLVHLYYPHSIFERLSVEEQEHILSLIDKEEAGDIDTGWEVDNEITKEVEGQDIGSSSHPKKHPDGVYFRIKTATRYIPRQPISMV
ncbi:hypothetical protein BGX24_002754 [Mortierella sp. AD032]|nr:hypothetical protein BGX24_002754 [Mortierella sp. AD032]